MILNSLLSGAAGFIWVDLALVAALVSAIACFAALQAEKQNNPTAHTWFRLGSWAFVVHALATFCIFATLLAMIFTHQYSFYYVWSHSSNELPRHFMLACLWEGQEGSFLIWMVWHAVLGLALLATAGRHWRSGVIGTLASLQAVLASMVLGVYLTPVTIQLLCMLGLLTAGVWLWLKLDKSPTARWLKLTGAVVWLFSLTNILLGQSGYLAGFRQPAFLLEGLFVLGFLLLLLRFLASPRASLSVALVSVLAISLILIIAWMPAIGWKIGSSPFILLKDALPDQAVFRQNANFIPQDGRGLNPLLQNYWMVIHPPTLFLGFALSVVPFAFVVTALLTRRYSEWISASAPWTILSVMVLGIGIIMGGYWAYETLNFGGYWNWDPVENASLVPWLIGVASLHLGLAYRQGKTNLRLAMGQVLATFLLVLYSTFLTRSGVLGDASVHSFTDLGLSGQLLVLLLAYLIGTVVLMGKRWREVPRSEQPAPVYSRAFFLLLAALVLCFAAVQITFVTSLPVVNKIFGSNLAAPGKLQLFYYKWQVWFGIAIGLLSATGQFVFWHRFERETILRALFRPFVCAALAAMVIIVLLAANKWDFVYTQTFNDAIKTAEQGSFLHSTAARSGYGLLLVADELLLFAGLFTVFANGDVLLGLLRRGLGKQVGGALAHIGIGLILIGILFSAGYEHIVSINLTPGDLDGAFTEDARMDNVRLDRFQPKYVKGYRVIYLGKREAQTPIRDLAVIYHDPEMLKVAFLDSSGERYGVDFPREFFSMGAVQSTVLPGQDLAQAVNLEKLKPFIEKNIAFIQPKLLNNRTLYALQFTPLSDTAAKSFMLYPEAEVNERMGLIAHPSRKVKLAEDLYVHVTSVPKAEADTAARQLRHQEARLGVGDTFLFDRGKVILEKLVQVKDVPEYAAYDAVVKAKLKIIATSGLIYNSSPVFIVDHNTARHVDTRLDALAMRFSFQGVEIGKKKDGRIVLGIDEEIQQDDYITFKALAKPYINVLWLGTFVMAFGFGAAFVRRVGEARRRKKVAAEPEPKSELAHEPA